MNTTDFNHKDIQLQAAVMRRVRAIHLMRRFANPLFIEGAVCLALGAAFVSLVSVSNVFANMSRLPSVSQYLSYLEGAFMHTQFVVQAVLVLSIVALGALARDIVRNVRGGVLKLNIA